MHSLVVFVFLYAAAQGLQEPRLVYPRLLQERSDDGKLIMKIHDQLTLTLEQALIAAPEVRFIKGGKEPEYIMYDGREINEQLYQDGKQLATVALARNGNATELKGLVGPSHRIEPLLTMERSDSGLIPHMVYEVEHTPVIDTPLHFEERDSCEDSEETRRRRRRRRGKKPRRTPERTTTTTTTRRRRRVNRNNKGEVVVEVFFVLDHPHFRHFKSKEDALMYICIMMNSANLRYTDVRNPRMRLMVTGAEEPTDEEYVRGTRKLLEDSATLKELQIYAKDKKNAFGKPDIVYLLSGRDVVKRRGNKLDKNAAGVGFIAAVCSDHYVALGEDLPGLYTGMLTLTHELGHVLGAVHDGDSPYAHVRGHPGARACPWADGFVMSYVNKDPNHQIFSQCSLRQIAHVLRAKGKPCWAVASEGFNMSTQYPGNTQIIKKICAKTFPDKIVETKVIVRVKNECKLRCLHKEKKGRMTRTFWQDKDAPDFVSCGRHKVCVKGRCVRSTNSEPAREPPQEDPTESPDSDYD